MEADRCSSGVEAKRIPAEKIIIFACDTTDVAEGREVNIKRWEIKEKNKMEMEIGHLMKCRQRWRIFIKKTMGAPSGELASKQSGHLVSHHQHHMAEAWRKFEEEARQMRKVEMNAYQYGEKKDMEWNVIIQQMRQAEGIIMEQKREIAVMKSYMASEKSAAQESAIRANQIHREASQQISVYQQHIRGIESSTSIEKFNEEEMVQSLKSQLEHALVKRPSDLTQRRQWTLSLNTCFKAKSTRVSLAHCIVQLSARALALPAPRNWSAALDLHSQCPTRGWLFCL